MLDKTKIINMRGVILVVDKEIENWLIENIPYVCFNNNGQHFTEQIIGSDLVDSRYLPYGKSRLYLNFNCELKSSIRVFVALFHEVIKNRIQVFLTINDFYLIEQLVNVSAIYPDSFNILKDGKMIPYNLIHSKTRYGTELSKNIVDFLTSGKENTDLRKIR